MNKLIFSYSCLHERSVSPGVRLLLQLVSAEVIISCSLHHNHVYTNHEEKNAGADGPLGNKEAVMQILAFCGEEKQCRKCKIEAKV